MIIFLLFVLVILLFLFSKVKIMVTFNSHNLVFNYSISFLYFKKIFTFNRPKIKKHFLKREGNIKKEIKTKNFINFIDLFTIEKLRINIKGGLFGTLQTVFFISIISTIISILFNKLHLTIDDNHSYKIDSLFDKFEISLNFESILSIKIVHIIYILLRLFFERGKNDGRTSNRGINEYCHE